MKKRIIIISSILIILIVGVSIFLIINNNKKLNNNVKSNITESKETKNNKKIDEDEVKEEVPTDETTKETPDTNQEQVLEKQEVSNVTSNTSSGQTTSVNQQPTPTPSTQSQVVNTPVVVNTPTEWEKLGISEYDYYNSPRPNEGEIAFREPESTCDRVSQEIASQYHFRTQYGDVHSYSEDYIGCWIVVNMYDGSWMFYSEFKQREARGEFNN